MPGRPSSLQNGIRNRVAKWVAPNNGWGAFSLCARLRIPTWDGKGPCGVQGYPGVAEAVEQPKMVGWVQSLGCRRGGGPLGGVEETDGGVGLNQWQGVAALLEQGQELAFKRIE